MQITKENFGEWKQHPITKTVFDLLNELVHTGMVELSYAAGEDPIQDAKRAGKIAGLRSLLEIHFDDVEENND